VFSLDQCLAWVADTLNWGHIMGMRIGGGYGSNWGNYQNTSAVGAQQQKQQLKRNLFSALESGDLTAAQTAYSSLQNQGIPSNSPLNAIGQSLQAGDLAGAQKAAQSVRAAHGHHMRVNDGDADDNASQAAAGTAAGAAANAANAGPAADPAAAFASFMQNLESALEQQDPSFANTATAQAGSSSTDASAPSTQAVLWSKGAGFSSSISDTALKADLDRLIQQLNASVTDPSAATAGASVSGGASNGTASNTASNAASGATSTPSTASVLQSSFATLLGSMGGPSSGVSVMNFLQSLDASLGNSSNNLNVSA
jgi:hypothetical protein